MFWKRTTGHAAFIGLLSGFLIAAMHHGLTEPIGNTTLFKGGWLGVIHTYPIEMAQNFWGAIFAFSTSAMVTIVLSLLIKQNKTETELVGLVYQLTPKDELKDIAWYRRPAALAILVLGLATILSIMFW
jgi:SSS family solute:Na+ symporter